MGLFWLDENYTSPDCELRANSTPEPPPIYPGSTFVRRKDLADSEEWFHYQLFYETTDPPQDVMEYYDTVLSDGCEFDYLYCRGDAEPVGSYHIDVKNTNPTEFIVGVSIERCYSNWP
jgi:hypothetical protein